MQSLTSALALTSLALGIATALGIPHDLVLMSPAKRPFKMGGLDGKPITEIFA